MKKKILYIDMDGVLADFEHAIKIIEPSLDCSDYENSKEKVYAICKANPYIFHTLKPIPGALYCTKKLFQLYDVYFLSTPMWEVPLSFTGKREWIGEHFGADAEKRLILTHRKDLAIGDILVDDRLTNGAMFFTGKHIHFGTSEFPNWMATYMYLRGALDYDQLKSNS